MAVLWVLVLVVAPIVGLIMWLINTANTNATTIADTQALAKDRFGEGYYHARLPGPSIVGVSWDKEAFLYGPALDAVELVSFADIRDADVVVDGVNITTTTGTSKTRRGSQLVGGAVGGALLGPAGLVAGGLSGGSDIKTKSVERHVTKHIKLVVRVADRIAPLREITFFENPSGSERIGSLAESYLQKANHLHALLMQVLDEQEVAAERRSMSAKGKKVRS